MNTDAVIQHIVQWLRDYADSAGCAGFVVGVSGGIDSAVTSALAARTGRPTMCCEMPIHQAESQISRARRHIACLEQDFTNVDSVWTELTPVFDAFITAMPTVVGEELRHHALANARARIRMTTLYYFAALHGYLVVGTGNRVEDFGIGFYTKYGDGGVDLSPIADLMKTEVYELGRALGVNRDIIEAPPTDGLWGDDRSDEDQIGASYPELEWAMEYDAGACGGNDNGTLSPRQTEVLEIYRRLNRANRHKMEPVPICEIPRALLQS
jgi:NAD+ synthase